MLLRVGMRNAVPSLIASLWKAACKTPYFESARRGADSYKPFVAGCIYALKRGVSLKDGQVVIPKLPILTEGLPTLRTVTTGTAAKALQASSHRGLCSLHRSIASCDQHTASKLFATSIHLASALAKNVSCGKFDCAF